jgi:hypothetical protein
VSTPLQHCNSRARRDAVAGQQLGKHVPEVTDTPKNRTVGRGVFYAVRVVSSTQHVAGPKTRTTVKTDSGLPES